MFDAFTIALLQDGGLLASVSRVSTEDTRVMPLSSRLYRLDEDVMIGVDANIRGDFQAAAGDLLSR